MDNENLAELSDHELLDLKKKMKRSSTIHAFIIGFLIGIILYSIANKSWSLLTLIPVYLIYLFVRGENKNKELKEVLRKRGL